MSQPSSAPSTEATAATPDEINRLWQHGLHEERLFHDRLNYFSATEIGLLGIFGIMYNKDPALGFFLPLTGIALLFTLLWLWIQVRHWRYCLHITAQIKKLVPDYRRTLEGFAAPGLTDGLSITRPLALAVPALFAATWVVCFTWLLVRPGTTVAQAEAVVSLDRLLLGTALAVLAWVVLRLRRVERLLRETQARAKQE